MFTSRPKRDKLNPKIKYYYENYYNDFDVLQDLKRGPLVLNYLTATVDEILEAVNSQPRLLMFRADLRFPASMKYGAMHKDNKVLTRFLKYFNVEIERASKAYKPFFRYVWAREHDASEKPHYHLLVMLNYNVFGCLGIMEPNEYDVYLRDNLFHRMMRCWYRALGLLMTEPNGNLIHIGEDPKTGKLWVAEVKRTNWDSINQAVYSASYLCKHYTKRFAEGIRLFNTSQGGKRSKDQRVYPWYPALFTTP